jgi:hypothetical protein
MLNDEDFSLKPVTSASLIRAKARVIGDGAAVIQIPAIGGEVEVRESAVKEWEEIAPAVDVPLTLKQIRKYLLDNPKKRKNNVKRFLTSWMMREQDSG